MGADTDSFSMAASSGLPYSTDSFAGLSPRSAPLGAAGFGERNGCESAVKAVLFDVEDVLYDASGWCRWLSQIFARNDQRCLASEFDRRWHDEFQPLVQRGDRTFFMAFAECLALLNLATAHVEEIVAAARAQRRKQEATLRTLPGARRTLAALHAAGVAVGILANIDRTAAALTADLSRLGVPESFACVLTSLDLRCCLPDKACYQTALSALDHSAGEVVFVGHHARGVVGARAAGLTALAFNAREGVPGAAQVDRLEDVLNFVPACAGMRAAEPQTV